VIAVERESRYQCGIQVLKSDSVIVVTPLESVVISCSVEEAENGSWLFRTGILAKIGIP
jgi:hypothetical protein